MLLTLARLLADVLYPPQCVGCHVWGQYVCASCKEELDYIVFQPTLRLDPKYLDSCTCAVRLTGVARKLMHECKYGSIRGIAEYIGMETYMSAAVPSAAIVCSVPLHWKRFNERGFNQAEVMARTIAKSCRLPYVDALSRTRHSGHQAQLSSKEDRKTLSERLFAPSQSLLRSAQATNPQEILTNLSVMLVDDVCTTGTTLNECAKVLKSLGATEVHGLTFAHGF